MLKYLECLRYFASSKITIFVLVIQVQVVQYSFFLTLYNPGTLSTLGTSSMKYLTRKKIIYFFKARHRKGHGIHSPFLFRLITKVMENKGNFSAYPLLKVAEENVRNTLRILDMESYHQEGIAENGLSFKDIKNLHLLPVRFDRLLFRLVNDFSPKDIAFYGSTFGITLLALALADRRIKLKAQVENDHYRSFCRRLVEVYEVDNVQLTGFGSVIASDFIVVQNPLDPDYCDRVLIQILAQPDYNGVIILCGIHKSEEMEAVWSRYKNDQVIRLSLDLFEIGIFICKKGLQKEDFVVRF